MSLKASAELYQRACRAFRRIHGYPHDGGTSDMRWLAAWQQGWLAGKRGQRK
jgi:hypothetical protein